MRSHLKQFLVLGIGGGTAFVMNAYVLVEEFCKPLFQGKKDASLTEEKQSDQKVNPNKMLFVSCGGFLE